MRKLAGSLGLCAFLMSTQTVAVSDVGDIDTYLMQDLETAIKDLEPVLGAGNVDSARADAEVLRDGLKWIEEYFAAKGTAKDAEQIARDGQQLVSTLFEHLEQKNLAAAIETARSTEKNCKRCHDIYGRDR
jgi:hypothetical protein